MKRIVALLALVLVLLCGCDSEKKEQEVKVTGDDTTVVSRLENIVELQKCLFRAKINGVETVDAIISKYNLDLSTYTMYTVDIVESFDGYTPTGTAHVYWAGTTEEFVSRVGLKQNESYILDAEPWVYGDEVVYILYPGTDSYPKLDPADGLTIAISDTEVLSVGTLDTYRDEYNKAVKAVDARIESFSDVKNAAGRFADIFKEMLTKNSDRTIYTERNYKWVPEDDFIDTTIAHTQEIYDSAAALAAGESVTKEQITELLK